MDQGLLAPIVAAVISGVALIIVAVLANRGRKSDARDNRAPSVKDAWAETERARRLYYAVLAMFWTLRTAARAYVQRVRGGGEVNPTDDELAAFELDPTTLEKETP